jgi:hypothetical protein
LSERSPILASIETCSRTVTSGSFFCHDIIIQFPWTANVNFDLTETISHNIDEFVVHACVFISQSLKRHIVQLPFLALSLDAIKTLLQGNKIKRICFRLFHNTTTQQVAVSFRVKYYAATHFLGEAEFAKEMEFCVQRMHLRGDKFVLRREINYYGSVLDVLYWVFLVGNFTVSVSLLRRFFGLQVNKLTWTRRQKIYLTGSRLQTTISTSTFANTNSIMNFTFSHCNLSRPHPILGMANFLTSLAMTCPLNVFSEENNVEYVGLPDDKRLVTK